MSNQAKEFSGALHETPTHYVEKAADLGGPCGTWEPYFQAWIQCNCGWESGRHPTWEAAGRAFDKHREQSLLEKSNASQSETKS